MPSKSASQARLFAAVAHDPAFAKKVGISQKVGRDFNNADKGTGIRHSLIGDGRKKKKSAADVMYPKK